MFELINIVDFPTRASAYLDKIFANDMSYKNAICCAGAPLGKSDHAIVFVMSAFLRQADYQTIYRRHVSHGH